MLERLAGALNVRVVDFFPPNLSGALRSYGYRDLRHTFASRLAMEAVDLMTIRDLMGHKTMTMTLRYSHLSPGHRQNAVERLVTRPVPKPKTAVESGAE